MESAPVADLPLDAVAGSAPAGACPFPHEALKKVIPSAVDACPVRTGAAAGTVTGAGTGTSPVTRSDADMFVRRLLRISDKPRQVSEAAAQRAFQRSMFISAIRCTLTYVVFPFVAPAIGFATGVGPLVGLIIGSVAIVCDIYTVRRFFAADHRWRWHFSAIALSISVLLMVLLVQDISHLLTN